MVQYVASKTVDSVKLLLNSLSSLDALVNSFDLADFKEEIAVNSLLTLVCERFFSDMRSRFEMPLMPRFAHLFGSNLGEFFKEDDRVRLLLLHVKEVILPMSAGLAGAALLDLLQDASAKSGPGGQCQHQDAAWLWEGVWSECEATICAFLLHQRQARHFTNKCLSTEIIWVELKLSNKSYCSSVQSPKAWTNFYSQMARLYW